jgi:hypothetical protein
MILACLADRPVDMLTQRVGQLEKTLAAQDRLSDSQSHAALVDAYKSLLRAEADKRLELVAAISTLRADMASAEVKQASKHVSVIASCPVRAPC